MKKISYIGFIFLFFILICSVNAVNVENETQDIISQIDSPTGEVEKYSASIENSEKLETVYGYISKASPTPTKVTKEKIKIKAPNVKMYYKDGSKLSVSTYDNKNKALKNIKLKITIDGKTYSKTTDSKGKTTLALNLKSGTYSVLSVFDGSSKYEKASAKSTVTIKSTIKSSDFKKIYTNSKDYSATFYDKKGKVLKNTAVKFKINGKTYSKKTDSKGVGKLSISLKPGKYTITITNSKTGESKSNTITTTPTIVENKDLVKYFKNTGQYGVKLVDANGKSVGKGKTLTFNINGVTYKKTTDAYGYAKLPVDLNPGTYTVKATYGSCSITNKITVKSLIESSDLTMKEDDGSKFNVKVLTSNGQPASNQKVVMKLNGQTYTKTSNANGIANLDINLDPGKYSITTEFGGLKNTNQITVNKIIKNTEFTYSLKVPSYVNVTFPYVFSYSPYSLKTGIDGIIKMPKIELISIEVNGKYYTYTTGPVSGYDATYIGYKSYLIPFDGSEVKSDLNKNNLKGNGLIISRITDFTQIEYRDTTTDNVELFGMFADKSLQNSETFSFMKNDKVTARVNFYTLSFDELGVKYVVGKYFGKTIYDFNYKSYDQITNGHSEMIKFANTLTPVAFGFFGNNIVGDVSREDILTEFTINGKEELSKKETISYGRGENYYTTRGFEVLQSFSIINEKITQSTLEKWVSSLAKYDNRFGVMTAYAMHLVSLETTWFADELANDFSKNLDLSWKRKHTATIMSGINLDKTYTHILNADMGMDLNGKNETTNMLFRLINSLYLPKLEDYALSSIANIFEENSTNSMDKMLQSIDKGNYSFVYLNGLMYIISEDSQNATIVINRSSGVASVIMIDDDFAYKGAGVKTTSDCCTICNIQKNIISHIQSGYSKIKTFIGDKFSFLFDKGLTHLKNGWGTTSLITGYAGKIFSSAGLGLISGISLIFATHNVENDLKNSYVNEKDWHYYYKHNTATRDGLLEGKKFYNIPKSDGSYDYIEIEINDDFSLNRDNALYLSDGKSRKLTKAETYKYFDEEYWSPYNIPKKYQLNKMP